MFAGLTAGFINAGMAVLAKFASQKFFEKIIEKVAIALLTKASKMTTNTVDDDLVKVLKEQFKNN